MKFDDNYATLTFLFMVVGLIAIFLLFGLYIAVTKYPTLCLLAVGFFSIPVAVGYLAPLLRKGRPQTPKTTEKL